MLGNHRVETYIQLLENMLSNFNTLGCNSMRVDYLYNHLDWFPENVGDFGKEQGKDCTRRLKLYKTDIKEDEIATTRQPEN